ncbi:crocetin glucosyltransferase, chloroplastic-like [Olea europaea subsp. europaea]|uniref:Glycosyltransferase n=1 Tax=Olea europaea subsp. europaea TaxID=158383 RepID=A0A8S0TTR0_OLEEU|nr:crocetin glucosyltransferase, chloroplastic-like [Olea europaea subsp. europaea]
MVNCHILLVSFPGQGHINPSLQFAKRLLQIGAKVTFSTSLSAISRMSEAASTIPGLTLAPFSDGYDNGWTSADDVRDFMSSFRNCGSEAVKNLLLAKENEGHPFTHMVYSTLVTWAGEVANELQIPSTLLWNQPATVFYAYYLYFCKNEIFTGENSEVVELPGLPLVLSSSDLPSFMQSSSPVIYNFSLPIYKEHFEILDGAGTRQKVLVNTFDALEFETLRAFNKYDLMGIGPLIPSAFLDGKDPLDTSFGGDLIQKTVDYIDWLNSKDELSVIYVSFGSFSNLSKQQMEEIAKGLIKSQKPFLWVIRDRKSGTEGEEDNTLSLMKEVEKQGMIVPWCSQLEVLSHPSVGCFLTHSGWNSCIESLSSGVPMVAFPQWADQPMNSKLVKDYWKTGLRAAAATDGGILMADEIARCLEIAMGGGERGEDMRKQAQKWKILAKEAVKEGGSSNVNLKAFTDQIVGLNQSLSS